MKNPTVGMFVGEAEVERRKENDRFVPFDPPTTEAQVVDHDEVAAIEDMIDRIESDYPNLSREELREIFHDTFERLDKAGEDSANQSTAEDARGARVK